MKAIWREGEEMCLVEERAKAGDLLFWRACGDVSGGRQVSALYGA